MIPILGKIVVAASSIASRQSTKSQKPGALQKGGKLEALKAVMPPTANDAALLDQSTTSSVSRVEDTTKDAHTKNCLCFNRLEGAAFAAGTLWFCDTNGS